MAESKDTEILYELKGLFTASRDEIRRDIADLKDSMYDKVSKAELEQVKAELVSLRRDVQPVIDQAKTTSAIKKSDSKRIEFLLKHGGKIIAALTFLVLFFGGGMMYESKQAYNAAKEAPSSHEQVVKR